MLLSKRVLMWLTVSWWRKRDRQRVNMNKKYLEYENKLEYNVMAEKNLNWFRPSLGLKRHCNDEESL